MIALCGYAALSLALVGLYRWLALRYRWLDTPNQRSSHTAVTPRGAGLIFALLIIGAAVVLQRSQVALLLRILAGLLVALVGWWDDVRGASARTRFIIYSVSAATAVALILSEKTLDADARFALAIPLIYALVATIGLVWLINLYNFMDGINGIAAIQALFVLGAIAFLRAVHRTGTPLPRCTGSAPPPSPDSCSGIFRPGKYSWAMLAALSWASFSAP